MKRSELSSAWNLFKYPKWIMKNTLKKIGKSPLSHEYFGWNMSPSSKNVCLCRYNISLLFVTFLICVHVQTIYYYNCVPVYIFIDMICSMFNWLESLSVDYMRKKIADVSYISVSDISEHIKIHIISQKINKLINALS